MKKIRTWFYLQTPAEFEVAPCPDCKEHDTTWSEYEGEVWCFKCKKEYVPEHNGMLDGPILIHTATLLGVSFDRFNILKNKVEKLNMETFEYEDKNSL